MDSSETVRASHTPVLPNQRGSKMNEGMRNTVPLISAKTMEGLALSMLWK